jgi:hypothetical protein
MRHLDADPQTAAVDLGVSILSKFQKATAQGPRVAAYVLSIASDFDQTNTRVVRNVFVLNRLKSTHDHFAESNFTNKILMGYVTAVFRYFANKKHINLCQPIDENSNRR